MYAKKPNPVDVAVGDRIRLYRLNARLSQTALGKKIGVSFPQVRKYEDGVLRVGVRRLTQIAAILDVPITAFFEGVSGKSTNPTKRDLATELLIAPRAFRLLEAFSAVPDVTARSAIVDLVDAIRRQQRQNITSPLLTPFLKENGTQEP